MAEENTSFAVLKINTALSNKPFFVRITDPDMSIDRIFGEAISTLNNTGRPLEGQQLDQLYKQHQLFSNGRVIQKGDLFKDLTSKNRIEKQNPLCSQLVNMGRNIFRIPIALQMISSQGIDRDKDNIRLFFTEIRKWFLLTGNAIGWGKF